MWRYPVKSMGEESLSEAVLGSHGLVGDRRWGFVRPGRVESGYPWLTIRERPEMSRYRPTLREPRPCDEQAQRQVGDKDCAVDRAEDLHTTLAAVGDVRHVHPAQQASRVGGAGARVAPTPHPARRSTEEPTPSSRPDHRPNWVSGSIG